MTESPLCHASPFPRLCVLSFRTHEGRVRDAVEALREEARRLLA